MKKDHYNDVSRFNEEHVLRELKHYLPAQAPLKDFIHHNTLHAFQDFKFSDGLQRAAEIFGYKVYLSLDEYRHHFKSGRITEPILEKMISEKKGSNSIGYWKTRLLNFDYPLNKNMRVGSLRANWRSKYAVDMDSLVHPTLFRILCNYLDQGVAIWKFPINHRGLLNAIKEFEGYAYRGFFRSKRVRKLLLHGHFDIKSLLTILVGREELFETYLFDLSFSHQGWSGIVSAIESDPSSLLDKRKITLKDFIMLELLFEIDALDNKLDNNWEPLGHFAKEADYALFAPTAFSELDEVICLWQEAYEWSYYDQVIAGLINAPGHQSGKILPSFQAIFCIDDRECSLRRYLEAQDPHCQTFATAGFFGVEFYYQPEGGKFFTKACPAPVTPKYLIREFESRGQRKKEAHFSKQAHALHSGWLISQTLGFWSALKLFADIFRPTMAPAAASSLKHMDKFSQLTIEHQPGKHDEHSLQVGFTVEEMTDRVEAVLKSIGLVSDFASLIYVVGHGASSVNNPHYAAYDCGACSGRAGSVNARVFSSMANHLRVRALLTDRGINIPDSTRFVGGLHDTTRDEVIFFDEDLIVPAQSIAHDINLAYFDKALLNNAKERSRRFMLVNSKHSLDVVKKKVELRSVSLFEPRPELNHATNALCIVGRRAMTRNLFLDRRSFLHSFDYRVDPEGKYLLNVLNACAPVCGGINLEYYFSRVDNQKLGAGSKLPHNVMGLFGVANGIDGDLRPGLPSQMTEVHEPVRLLMVVEHFPEVVLKTIQLNHTTYQWFENEWVHLMAVNPETREISRFKNGLFIPYKTLSGKPPHIENLISLIESTEDNLPVGILNPVVS